jgi:4,5-dihydroxyphthalate decarboxylase
LIGKRIASPEYQMTAPVWIRGILEEHYQVPHTSVQYLTGGAETAGRDEKIKLQLPPAVKIAPIGPAQTLTEMIANGDIDAMHTARAPSTFYSQPHKVKRLFENYPEVELAYYQKTKILPIMHTVVIRRDVYEQNRWMAQSLFKAFVMSQKVTYQSLREVAALKTMLPWLPAHVEQLEKELGPDWWAYGFQSNRHVLETFLRYHHQQGLSHRLLKPEELFAPETFEAFKI